MLGALLYCSGIGFHPHPAFGLLVVFHDQVGQLAAAAFVAAFIMLCHSLRLWLLQFIVILQSFGQHSISHLHAVSRVPYHKAFMIILGLTAGLATITLVPQAIPSSEHVQPIPMRLLSFLLLPVISPPEFAALFSFFWHQLSSDYTCCPNSYSLHDYF